MLSKAPFSHFFEMHSLILILGWTWFYLTIKVFSIFYRSSWKLGECGEKENIKTGVRLLGRVLDGYLQDELSRGSPVHSTLIQGCCLEVSVLVFNRFLVVETHFPCSSRRDGNRYSLNSSLT